MPQQGKKGGFLLQGARIGRLSAGGETAFVADADGVVVMVLTVRADFFHRAAAVDVTVARDVEVITDVAKTAVEDVVVPAVFKAQAHALRRGRAMDDE